MLIKGSTMDPTSFGAPACARILTVPAVSTPASVYEGFVGMLKRAARVPLLDVTPPSNAAPFDIKQNPTGFLTFAIDTAPPPENQKVLLDLEQWRRQLIAIAVTNQPESPHKVRQQLKQHFPSAVTHAVVIFADSETETKSETEETDLEGVYTVYQSNWTSVEQVMAALASQFLGDLADFWSGRQLASFKSPLELLPSAERRAQTQQQTNTSNQPQRSSSGSHRSHKSHRSLVGRHGSISMTGTERAKQVQTGRSHTFLGTLLMLAGLPAQALQELAVAASALQQTADHLWAGAAFNAIACCLTSLYQQGAPVSVPPAVLSAVGGNTRIPLEGWRLIEAFVSTALEEYAQGTGDELVPYTVYFESVTRYAGMLVNIRLGRPPLSAAPEEGDDLSLENEKESGNLAENEVLAALRGNEVPSLQHIDSWLSQCTAPNLQPDTQATILRTGARLYRAVNMRRKWAFVCVQIVGLLAASSASSNRDVEDPSDVLAVYKPAPNLEAQLLHRLVSLGHRTRTPVLQTSAASRLLGLVPQSRIPHATQLALYHLICNFGDQVQSPFWDPQMVVSAEVRTGKNGASPGRQRMKQSDTPGIIYNPFDQQQPDEHVSELEVGVAARARIWLRNILSVDVQVFSLVLTTKDGTETSSKIEDFVIPANSHRFRVDVVVQQQQPGAFEAACVRVQVAGCAPTVLDLPQSLKLRVVPPRPVLALQSISLLKGCAMLLEGERRDFEVELLNLSNTDANILQQPPPPPLRHLPPAPGGGKPGRIELYEHELMAAPPVELKSELKPIKSKECAKLNFQLVGKHGAHSASVVFEYGHSKESLRRFRIPIQLTVHRCVFVERYNLLPAGINKILLVVDIRNAWREGVRCAVWTTDSSEKPDLVQVEPGASNRFVLELNWTAPSPSELKRPVPLANPRFSIEKHTPQELVERFWLRESLLSKLRSRWETDERVGEIDLRKIELGPRSADLLRGGIIAVSAPHELEGGRIDEIVTLKVKVKNEGDSPVSGMLRLAPDRPAQKFMLTIGCPQRLVVVSPNSEVEEHFDMLFVSGGQFSVATVLDAQGGAYFQAAKTRVCVS